MIILVEMKNDPSTFDPKKHRPTNAKPNREPPPGLWNAQSILTPKGLIAMGVVLKKPATPLSPEGSGWATLKKTVRTYFLSPHKGTIDFRAGKHSTSAFIDQNGGFEIDFSLEGNEELEITDPDTGKPIPRLHSYPHRFDYRRAKYLVISDIDDTILVSKSSRFFSKIWLMLFRQTSRRNSVEETEQAYRKLMAIPVNFVYVSASEFNLFSIISNFIVHHDLPVGPVLLRPFQHWKNLLKPRERGNYKVKRIRRLVNHFPDTQFVLFGDDSQHDPGVFAEIAAEYPVQIRAIFLRKTGYISSEKSDIKRTQIKGEVEVHTYSTYADIEQPINKLIDEITNRS